MSWELIALNIVDDTKSLATLTEKSLAVLGSRQQVRNVIRSAFPDADFGNETQVVVHRERYTIKFQFGPEEPVQVLTLQVHGTADAVDAVTLFAEASGWALLDSALGDLIDFASDDPVLNHRRWVAYREFLNQD